MKKLIVVLSLIVSGSLYCEANEQITNTPPVNIEGEQPNPEATPSQEKIDALLRQDNIKDLAPDEK